MFDEINRRSNPLGLFSEEYDPEGNHLLGNFPQGLTHIALINAAATLRDVEGRAPQPRGR
jgi:GH15 family glucan-1,4-alpha-glucosidase